MRDCAVAIGVVPALLYLFPIVANVVGDESWPRHLEQIGPMTAGLATQATTGLRSLPVSPWAGLGVLVLPDLGSAVLVVKAVLEDHGGAAGVLLADGPFVEGAVAATVTAAAGGDLKAVAAAAEEARHARKL